MLINVLQIAYPVNIDKVAPSITARWLLNEKTIVAAYDEENDILPNTEEFLSMEGNYVYIKIDETGTFLLLNH